MLTCTTGAITWALDLTAAGLIIQYWQSSISIGVWIAVFLVVFTCTNLIPVRWFANVEAWLASVKVITVVGFAIFGICIVSGGSPSGNSPLGFRYWSWPFSISATESQSLTAPSNVVDTGPGPFGAGFVFPLPLGAFTGFWSVLIQACFSYQGAELVSLGLSELAPPNSSSSQIQVRRVATSWKTSFPFAVRSAFLLITLLFLITVLMIGLLVPASDSRLLLSSGTSAAASPFVIATDRAGIPSLAGLINAVLLTAILSAGNANVFSGSRILAALAEDGLAPSWFGRQRTWRGGVQGWGVLATSAVGLLAFLNLGEATGKVFLWLLGICSVSGVLTWLFVGVAHVRLIAAMKAQRRDRNTELLGGCRRGYRSRFQPWLAWWGIGWNIVILVTQGFTAFVPRFDGREFAFAYVSILLFLALLVGHGLWTGRWKWVELSDIPLRDPESR